MDPARPDDPAPEPAPVLDYAAPGAPPVGVVAVATNATLAEAGLYRSVLEASGIAAEVVDRHTDVLGPYTGGVNTKVLVRAPDAERAAAVLRDAAAGNLEPADDPPGAPAPADADGNPVTLVVAAAFDHPRPLHEAAATLAAARVPVHLPPLVSRGDRPPGEGKRFLLKVAEADLDRARALLDEADAEAADDDEPRCPRCRSWRVFAVGGGVRHVIGRLFGGAGDPPGFECLACGHRAEAAAFAPSRD